MFYQLMPLHWGLVNLNIEVDGVDPTSRVLPPVAGGDTSRGVAANAVISEIVGRGMIKRVSGSGIIKSVGGRGKLCP